MKTLVIVISSNNKNKLREYKEIFEPYKNVIIKSLSDVNIDVDPIENGNTFQENSLIKANAVTNLTDEYVIADDSGLEILALDNFPGIHSSRFMKGHTYQEKCQAIFDMLKDMSPRTKLYAGLFVTFMNGSSEDLIRQIHEARKLNLGGIILFDYAHLQEKYIKTLTASVFSNNSCTTVKVNSNCKTRRNNR